MNDTTRVRRAPGILFREIQGEAVLLDPDSGSYFAVNEVGTVVWEELEEESTVAELTGVIVDEFEVDEETAREDLEEFLGELLGQGLVEVQEA